MNVHIGKVRVGTTGWHYKHVAGVDVALQTRVAIL
jgi:hypothetical protein